MICDFLHEGREYAVVLPAAVQNGSGQLTQRLKLADGVETRLVVLLEHRLGLPARVQVRLGVVPNLVEVRQGRVD